MLLCKKCGFPISAKPSLLEKNGVCQACINHENKKNIDFKSRQEWLTQFIKDNKGTSDYDCVVAVSGGKDSTMIVKRLMENHGIINPLLVNVADEYTKTKAGAYNISNFVSHFNVDLLTIRFRPKTAKEEALHYFEEKLFPTYWLEEQIYKAPLDIAEKFGINLVFYGENSAYEYGTSEELDIFHPASTDSLKVVFLGAIYPYSTIDSLMLARECGFKDLNDFNEWYRQGNIENYTQIDSVGYIVALWCKFIKFGYQRVSDMACRFVREGLLTKEQAELLIKEKDYILDPAAKADFCRLAEITEEYFNEVVDRFANKKILIKDVNGNWRRKDLF